MRVLIIEDEEPLLEQLRVRLKQEGYAVDSATDGEEGQYLALEVPCDAAIIDLGLPKQSGIELIRKVRAAGKTFPILILTARSRWQEKVEGLESGADDYMVKPFQMEELLARLRALVRRAAGWSQSHINCGPINLNTATQDVTVKGQPIELTAYEYKVLEYLMLHAGHVVSKSDLTDHLYEQDFDRDSNVIEVFVGRLRRKLDPDNDYNPIETLRGRGYRLTLERTSP
jgi:two-component system response regulator PhoP